MLEERKALELKYHALHVAAWKQRSDALSGNPGIPKFWLQAFSNHPAVGDFIEDHDLDALAALKDVTWEYLPELKVRANSVLAALYAADHPPACVVCRASSSRLRLAPMTSLRTPS